jgi:hypothetical protein
MRVETNAGETAVTAERLRELLTGPQPARRGTMTRKEALAISGRSESWLRRHVCAWCDQTLYHALRHGCGAIYGKCNPADKRPKRRRKVAK